MGTIVAIGGGNLRLNETFQIDKQIVELAQKKNPKVLFIPTASNESQGYIDTFKNVYEKMLGCATDSLKILTERISDLGIRDKIFSADIIYVGGGNTQKMMDEWKKRNIDHYLLQAYDKGTILCGMSAGSICWFQYGHSDSFLNITGEYCLVEGLGIIPGIHCPHYDERTGFDDFMKIQEMKSIAIENNCAIVFSNGLYKVMKSIDTANAFLIQNKNGSIYRQVIDNIEFLGMKTLFYKNETE